MQPKRPYPPQRRPSTGGRPSAYRGGRRPVRRRATRRSRLMGFIFIAVALIAIVFFIDTIALLGVGQARFYNVYVNGISLEGYTKEEGFALFETLEQNWAEQTYTFTYGDYRWDFSPSTIDANLNVSTQLSLAWNFGHVGSLFNRKAQVRSLQGSPVYYTSTITYNEDLLNEFIASIQAVTDHEPVDAVVVLDVSGPVIATESELGFKLNVDEFMETLNSLMLTGEGNTVLPVETLEPSISSTDAANGLQVIATCQTDTSTSRSNRITNIRVALGYFNGIAIEPGVEYSFNDIVGKRTTARGFKESPEYSEGEVVSGIGGGTCQASTTLYGALLRAGMTIVRRSPHSMTVGYVPASQDAAVTDTGSKDLVFRNDTDSTVYIYTSVTKKTATVVIYGKKPEYRYEIESKTLQDNIAPSTEVTRVDTTGEYATYTDERVLGSQGKSGRVSEAYRVSYDWVSGEEVAREKLSTDTYKAGVTVYYTGTQEREVDAQIPAQLVE